MKSHLKKTFIFALFALLMILSACAPASSSQTTGAEAPSVRQDLYGKSNGGAAPGADYNSPASPAVENEVAAGLAEERLVIRNANLTIVVDDPTTSLSAITQMAEAMGGFVVASNLYKTSNNGVETPEGNITVRVPSDKLNEALEQIKSQVKDREKDVRSETVSGQDVTKEYTDLNSKLKNLEQTEAQLREIMGSATKTEDVLAVYQQLTQIREQIEVIKGQIQYYKESAALSAISVTIQSQAAIQPVQIGSWKPVGVARDAVQALIDTLQFLASAAIWMIVYILPVGLLIFLPLRLLWWLFRRNRKKGQMQPPVVQPPSA